MKCRFCKQLAIAKVFLSRGCFCYPNDKEQYLCFHHLDRAHPLGDMEVEWLTL